VSAFVDALDLLSLIGRDTPVPGRPSAATNGGEYKARCPLPGCRSQADALCIWPRHPGGRPRWWCRACGRGGDAVAWQVEMGRLSRREAWDLRHGRPLSPPLPPAAPAGPAPPVAACNPGPAPPVAAGPALLDDCLPPVAAWQAAGRAFVARAQEALWAPGGERALAWLRGRGLHEATVRAAGLGYNGRDERQPRPAWGLAEGSPVWLPRGIVIPWEAAGHLWRINVRRPAGEPKYCGPAGFCSGLYNAAALAPGRPAVLLEGELDALTVAQVAGDLAAPVALGSTEGARRRRWIDALARCSLVLVALDADEDPHKGDRAAAWWVSTLPNARRWRPWWADANQMHQDGADLRLWLAAGLP
jgi:DNA primase